MAGSSGSSEGSRSKRALAASGVGSCNSSATAFPAAVVSFAKAARRSADCSPSEGRASGERRLFSAYLQSHFGGQPDESWTGLELTAAGGMCYNTGTFP